METLDEEMSVTTSKGKSQGLNVPITTVESVILKELVDFCRGSSWKIGPWTFRRHLWLASLHEFPGTLICSVCFVLFEKDS